jgi:hypothetical protein
MHETAQAAEQDEQAVATRTAAESHDDLLNWGGRRHIRRGADRGWDGITRQSSTAR